MRESENIEKVAQLGVDDGFIFSPSCPALLASQEREIKFAEWVLAEWNLLHLFLTRFMFDLQCRCSLHIKMQSGQNSVNCFISRMAC